MMCIHLCLTHSLKNLTRTINVNCKNCYICIHSYKVNTYLRILTSINIAGYQCVMNMYMYLAMFVCVGKKRL